MRHVLLTCDDESCSPSMDEVKSGFAETKDFVRGLTAIEYDDPDGAIKIAAGPTYARWGSGEIRSIRG